MATGSTILLVDDYPDSLDVWALYLQAVGFLVRTARDGASALREADRARPDLIVLDLELPGMSGVDVARALRSGARTGGIPLIAATGYSHHAMLAEARQLFDSIVTKPCDPDALVVEIRRLLAAKPSDPNSGTEHSRSTSR